MAAGITACMAVHMAVETYLPQPPPPPVGPQVHQGVQGSALQTEANKEGGKEQHEHGKQTERCVT